MRRMLKRRPEGRGGGRSEKRRRQHLYLLFDDWLWGYSVRKVDLSSDIDSEGSELQTPRVDFRLVAEHRFSRYITAAFGTKIIAIPLEVKSSMPPIMDDSGSLSTLSRQLGGFPVLDVHPRGLTYWPMPKVDLMNPIYIPIGNRLFVLSSNSFQVLRPPSVDEPDGRCRKGLWRKLPLQPFHGDHITSYAVHPDGRTIFISTKKYGTSTMATYKFDTAEPISEWKKQGDWALPFTGRAHFDPNLGAWVGIRGDLNSVRYICACDVVSAKSEGGDCCCPSWKLSKEALFSERQDERHVGANLVFMGSKFCLVESVSINDGAGNHFDSPFRCESCQFRLTTFSLEHDKNGDLTTANSHRVRYYHVPEAAVGYSLMDPVAFWL